MEQELLRIFDEDRNEMGVATREEVHRLGHWHETFQCWFVSKEQDKYYIYLQLRSKEKKDFPNVLDITAAGHLLASEDVTDGVREVQEELGIEITFSELISLGIIENRIVIGDFLDNELSHVFLYKREGAIEEFVLQKEEVAGIVKLAYTDLYELWLGDKQESLADGFVIDEDGQRALLRKMVRKEDFVPHDLSYYETVLARIGKHLHT